MEPTVWRRRQSDMYRATCAVALGLLVAACSSATSKTTSPTSRPALPTTTTGAHPVAHSSNALLAACETGARGYGGVPIAAFRDPSNAGKVICWADGHVAKSPPPSPGGPVPPSYDRLVFRTTLDGKGVVLIEAGYRSSLPVLSPTMTACQGIVGQGSHSTVAAVNASLRMTGGISRAGSGAPVVAGTVVATDPVGRRCTRGVGPTGWVTMTVDPGMYSFTGSSPSFGDGKYTCFADRPIQVDAVPVTSQGPPPIAQVNCARR